MAINFVENATLRTYLQSSHKLYYFMFAEMWCAMNRFTSLLSVQEPKMLCDFFLYFGPCFELVKRIEQRHANIIVEGSLMWNNRSEFLSCETRCKSMGRQVPSYSLVKQANLINIYDKCKNKSKDDPFLDSNSECGFPIDVEYSFQQKQWLGKYVINFLHYQINKMGIPSVQ